jgi:hypothetical protein
MNNVINDTIHLVKDYYSALLTTPIRNFSDEFDPWILSLIEENKGKLKDTLPLDLHPELILAFGSDASKYASASKTFLEGQNRFQGLFQIAHCHGFNLSYISEETGHINFQTIETIEKSGIPALNWPPSLDNLVMAFVDPVDGSSLLKKILETGKGVVYDAIQSYVDKIPDKRTLNTHAPTTGITLLKDNKIMIGLSLNLLTGKAMAAFKEGVYVFNTLDYSGPESLSGCEASFSEEGDFDVLCYTGKKGNGREKYERNIRYSGLSQFRQADGYTTGPGRLSYLMEDGYFLRDQSMEKLGIVASCREKLNDVGPVFAGALYSKDLDVFLHLDAEDSTSRLITDSGEIRMDYICSQTSPRDIRLTFSVMHKDGQLAAFYSSTFNC